MRTLADLPERIASKIEPEPMSGCWLWAAGTCRGYGKIWWEGRLQQAHSVVFKSLVGPVPADLQLDHLCRNRACVSPWHLEPVTVQENIRRGRAGAWNREKTHCSQGHPFDHDNTFWRPDGSRRCIICNRERALAWYHRQKKGGTR